MCDAITHRGPDDQGYFFDGNVGLGMRRLSIIDIAGGRQPVHNENRTIWTVFNGEIYNYYALRNELESRGHRFYTNSDTETIVHLYEEFGDDFVTRLNGMFAIALWDSLESRLILCRDRIGEKQLFLARANGTLAFGSEIKCLLRSDLVSRDIDIQSVDEYLRFLYVPAPKTIYRDILELPPATIVTVKPSEEPKMRTYWRLQFTPRFGATEPETIERIREQLLRSVRSRLISDVPVGALLSGGVDSSAVVAAMVRADAGPVRTFTIGYGTEGGYYDERAEARELAQTLGTEHHEFVVHPDLQEVIQHIVEAFDQPFADSSAVANWYVFRETRAHVKVVLTGLGGDEVFAGYERHMAIRYHQVVSRLPRWVTATVLPTLANWLPEARDGGRLADRIKRFAAAVRLPAAEAYHQYVTAFSFDQRRDLYTEAMNDALDTKHDAGAFSRVFNGSGDTDPLHGALYTDTLGYLPGDLMTLTDRMSMAHSVEARAPLVDHELVELMARVPASSKIRGRTKKYLLREAVRPWLPPGVLDRPKKGFTIPITIWLRGVLEPWMRDVLAPARIARTGLFSPAAVTRLIDEHVARLRNHHARLWALLVFMHWFEREQSLGRS
jgi:asparagine synthase (glutamine-hydrolysing)